MANPFAIFGGLTTTGAQGAAGGLEGLVGGEVLRRRLTNEDLLNQLRAIQIQQTTQPQYQITPQGAIMRFDPRGGVPTAEGQVPQRPPTDLERAHTGYYNAEAARIATGKGIPPEHERLFADWQAKNPGRSYLDFYNEVLLPALRKQHAAPTKYVTDASGNVRAITPEGITNYGLIGKPQRPLGGAGMTPKVTEEVDDVITPRKYVTDPKESGQIQQGLEGVVNEIAANPRIQGWMSPGAMVRVEGYNVPVRREDIIADRVFKTTGIHVAVRWDPSAKRWTLIRAWTGGDVEQRRKRKTVGPPSEPKAEADEED